VLSNRVPSCLAITTFLGSSLATYGPNICDRNAQATSTPQGKGKSAKKISEGTGVSKVIEDFVQLNEAQRRTHRMKWKTKSVKKKINLTITRCARE
jgi:hypothetical protein